MISDKPISHIYLLKGSCNNIAGKTAPNNHKDKKKINNIIVNGDVCVLRVISMQRK